MSRFVVDASVAIKWIVHEEDSDAAVAVLGSCPLSAPDLLVAECSNILWKKVRRTELSREQAIVGARLLQSAEIELLPTRHLIESATRLALDLDYPAYDCIYLALAIQNGWPFVTADTRLRRKVSQSLGAETASAIISMRDAVAHHAARKSEP